MATAGDGGGPPNVKGVPFDGAASFGGSAAGGCSGDRLGVGAEADFTGPPNVKGGARDGVVVVGFSASLGNTGGAPKVEDTAAESGVGVANADMDCDGAPNSDGVVSTGFGTFGSGTSAGFGCSTAGTVSNGGSVVIAAGLAKTDEWAKKLGIPEDIGVILEAGAVFARTVGASEATFTVSGVGGTSDILGSAGAGVGGTGSEAAFAVSAAGGAGTGIDIGAGLLRENGSEVIGGSVAWVRSCVIVVYKV